MPNKHNTPTRVATLILTIIVLYGCTPTQNWTHPTKSEVDFKLDERTCHELALSKAKAASLTSRPIASIYWNSMNSCLRSYGWTPSNNNAKVTAVPCKAQQQRDGMAVTCAEFTITFKDTPMRIIADNSAATLVDSDGTYAVIAAQLAQSGFIKSVPPVALPAVEFDSSHEGNLFTSFFYQSIADRLIFACTSYIFIGDNERIIITLSRDMFPAPKQFNQLDHKRFAQLVDLQNRWTTLLLSLAAQIDR